MVRFLCGMLLIVASASLPRAGAGDAALQADLKKMQGKWRATILEIDGKEPTPEEKNAAFELVIAGEKYVVSFGGKPLNQGTLKLGREGKTQTLDATHTAGPFKGMVQKGLYAFEGADFRVVFAKPGEKRPLEMKTSPGSQEVLMVYRKVVGKK